jgi:hypothetical protein
MLKQRRRASFSLLRSDNLQLARNMYKVIGVSLRDEPARIRFLHKVLVALLIRKGNGIFLALEMYALTVHEVGGGLPAHEGILPSMAFGERIPVHDPAVGVPVTGLCRCFCRAVDSVSGSLVGDFEEVGEG